jgi:RHS repeat-associated protein
MQLKGGRKMKYTRTILISLFVLTLVWIIPPQIPKVQASDFCFNPDFPFCFTEAWVHRKESYMFCEPQAWGDNIVYKMVEYVIGCNPASNVYCNGNIPYSTWEACLSDLEGTPTEEEPSRGECYAACSDEPPPEECNDDQCNPHCMSSSAQNNLRSGALSFRQPLITTPPHSLPLAFEVFYSSKHNEDRGMGVGWSHSFLSSISEVDTDDVAIVTRKTGSSKSYIPNGDGTYQSPTGDYSTLVKSGNDFILTYPDGIKWTYSVIDGTLESIENLNGNTLTLTYSGDDLVTVSDNFSRSLTFTYDANNKLHTVTDPNSNTYTFVYEEDNLVAIVYPDTSQERFEYNDPNDGNNITRRIDNKDQTVGRYQYDAYDRVTVKSEGEDSEKTEITYSPGVEVFSDTFSGVIKNEWQTTGTVEVVDDPEIYGEDVVRIHPGSMTYTAPEQNGAYKLSFNIRFGEKTTEHPIKVYNSTEGQDYGAWLIFTGGGTIKTKILMGDPAEEYILSIAGSYSTSEWHKVEMVVDGNPFQHYMRVWFDCEYLGRFPLRTYLEMTEPMVFDTLSISASQTGGNIWVDNVLFEKIVKDGSKRIITDSKGNVTTFNYTKLEGGGYTYSFDGEEGCSHCGGGNAIKLYEYDADRNLIRTVNRSDIETTMTWDDRGNMLTKTEASGTALSRTTTYTYHQTFNKVATITVSSVDTQGQNKVITNSYDANNGNRLSETIAGYSDGQPFSHVTSYQYNTFGQITQVDGPRTDVSDVTTYQHHQSYGYLTSITYPNGTVTYAGYDSNHNVGSITDLNGVVTSYTYDYANRVRTITVGSAITTYHYDEAGNIDYVEMPEGNFIYYQYDAADRLIKITDDLGNYISYSYDSEGNKLREEIRDNTNSLKKYLNFEYDQFNRLSKAINPDNSSTQYDYDSIGNRTKMTNPLNKLTEYEYDVLNRLRKVTQAKGTSDEAVTEYNYDTQDNLTWVKDAQTKITTYDYDDAGRLLETVSPDTGTTSYSYDPAGNLLVKTDEMAVATEYEYDALNRLTKIDYPTDTDTVYIYDETDVGNGKGRLTTMQDATGVTRYSYDTRGNLVQEQKTMGTVVYTTGYSYNLNNALASITYPGGRVVDYSLNSLGNITQVETTTLGVITSQASYEPFGGLKGITFANGIATTFTHDTRYQVKTIQAGTVLNRTFTHDFNGNVTSTVKNDSLPLPSLAAITEDYTYVTATDLLDEIDDGTNVTAYTHDGNGNITAFGNKSLTYNEDNRLIQVATGGNPLGVYTYNGKGQRVTKTAGETAIVFHYDLKGNLIAESDTEGTILKEYLYLGDMRLATIQGGTIYYHHNDHLGTPLALTDSNAAVVWSAAYKPFGDAQVDQGSTQTNNFRFPGQYYDQETGLHYNWHRYYDPKTGRYVTADPIGQLIEYQKLNHLYNYVENNPIKRIDKFGLMGDDGDWIGIIGPFIDPYLPDLSDVPDLSDIYSSWPFNGNLWPGFSDQNMACNQPADGLNQNQCTKKCCVDHDKCYERFKCNFSSWIPGGMSGPCKACNFLAVICVMKNMSKDRCGECEN